MSLDLPPDFPNFSACSSVACSSCFLYPRKFFFFLRQIAMPDCSVYLTFSHQNSVKESIFGQFLESLGLSRFVTKQFCLFRLFRYRFETPKQTETFCFWFHETNAKQILFRFEPKFIFVCFEDTLPVVFFLCVHRWKKRGLLHGCISW
jgi:hypothetical protein